MTAFSRIFPLYVVIFFGFVGYSMMITLFTPFFMYAHDPIISADSGLHYRIIVLGIVLALFPLAQFFGSPILGTLSDRFGRRRILLLSLYVAPICYALLAFSLNIHSLSLLMVGSLIAGFSQANIVIAQSAIADIATPQERGRLFGYIYLSASAAYIAGPLIGGKLADRSLLPWFTEATPFWLVCILLLLTLFWTQFSFKETKLKKESHISYRHALTALLSIFTSRKLRLVYLTNFLLYFAIFGFFRCYPMYIVVAFHTNTSTLSEFIAWVGLPIILVNLGLTGYLFKRFSAYKLTLWSSLLTGIFMIFIVFPSSMNSLWGTLFLTSGALALALPACATMLSLKASKTEQGQVMGNNQALQVAAEALSAFVGGLLAAITIKLPFVVLGLLACLVAVIVDQLRISHFDRVKM